MAYVYLPRNSIWLIGANPTTRYGSCVPTPQPIWFTRTYSSALHSYPYITYVNLSHNPIRLTCTYATTSQLLHFKHTYARHTYATYVCRTYICNLCIQAYLSSGWRHDTHICNTHTHFERLRCMGGVHCYATYIPCKIYATSQPYALNLEPQNPNRHIQSKS
jgi:hypothetical protein